MKRIMRVTSLLLFISIISTFQVQAATKVPSIKCRSDWEEAKSVKVGKSYVKVIEGEYGYVKFKANKSGTYKFTVGNVRRFDSYNAMTSMQFALQQERDSWDEPQTLTNRDGELLHCSAIYNSYYCDKYGGSPSSYTCKVRNVKKGDVFYLWFYDGYDAKCTLKIKYSK